MGLRQALRQAGATRGGQSVRVVRDFGQGDKVTDGSTIQPAPRRSLGLREPYNAMIARMSGLTHGLTNYGDKDFSLYLRRSFARSLGYSRAMLEKPVVGIAYTG